MEPSRCGAPLTLPWMARTSGSAPHTGRCTLSTPASGRASPRRPARYFPRGGCRGSPSRTVPRRRRSREPLPGNPRRQAGFPSAPGMATIRDMGILVVDDDQAVRDSLRRALALQGYDVELAGDGEEALFKLRANPHATDLLVVDVLMPRLDGLELTRRLRSDGSELPILMLTARDQVADRVRGLEAGADDYLIKPFALEELVARLRALVRRKVSERTAVLEAGGLRFDTRTGSAEVDGHALRLTQRESMFLERLLLNLGQPVSQQQLLEQLWDGEPSPSSNIAEVYVSRLRRKLNEAGAGLTIITLKRLGYQLERAIVEPQVAGAQA